YRDTVKQPAGFFNLLLAEYRQCGSGELAKFTVTELVCAGADHQYPLGSYAVGGWQQQCLTALAADIAAFFQAAQQACGGAIDIFCSTAQCAGLADTDDEAGGAYLLG